MARRRPGRRPDVRRRRAGGDGRRRAGVAGGAVGRASRRRRPSTTWPAWSAPTTCRRWPRPGVRRHPVLPLVALLRERGWVTATRPLAAPRADQPGRLDTAPGPVRPRRGDAVRRRAATRRWRARRPGRAAPRRPDGGPHADPARRTRPPSGSRRPAGCRRPRRPRRAVRRCAARSSSAAPPAPWPRSSSSPAAGRPDAAAVPRRRRRARLGLDKAAWHTRRAPVTRSPTRWSAAPTPGAGSPTTCWPCRGRRSASSPSGAGGRVLDDAAQGQPGALDAGPARRAGRAQLAATAAPRRRRAGRRARRRRLARRVGDAGDAAAPHRRRRARRPPTCSPGCGSTPTGWPPTLAARPRRRRAPSSAAWPRSPATRPTRLPRATASLVDGVLERAARARERSTRDPDRHRRPPRPAPPTAPSCRCWCSAPRSGTSATTLWTAAAARPDRRLRRRRLGPARATATTGRPRGAAHDGRARRRRARVVDDILADAVEPAAVPLRRRLGRRRGRPAAAARRTRPGAARGAAVHRRQDRRRRECGRTGSAGPGLGHAGAGAARPRERWFGPGFLDREPERGSGAAARAAGRRRRGLRPRSARRSPTSTCATGSARSRRPCSRWPGTTTRSPRRAGCAQIADGVADGRLVVLDGVAHLAPAEAPEVVARLIREHVRRRAGA